MPDAPIRISLVVAASDNNVIGKDNQLVWKLPNDLKFFKNTTWGMPVIMGRKTFQSLGKALKGRTNIVLTSKPNFAAPEILVTSNWQEALAKAAETDAKEVFVIGGGEIYRQSMAFCHRMYITRVHATLDGDTFFPSFSETHWRLHSQLNFEADERHAYGYSFEIWDRIGTPDDVS